MAMSHKQSGKPDPLDQARAVLKKYWGYPAFRPFQEEIIRSVLEGRDTLAVMATGGGKSLCYQVPALCIEGIALVISPLVSLMKDQADDLNERGIVAAAYTGSMDSRKKERFFEELRDGSVRLLYVSPERCMQPQFVSLLRTIPVSLVAIDEAHCISEWGHNFRPEYRQLSQLKKIFSGIPFIALTASAVPEVRKDICGQLGLTDPREFIGSFDRRNLQYRVIQKKNPLVFLSHYLGQHREDSGIIYCLSKKEAEDIAEFLKKRGFLSQAYHAGFSPQIRSRVQEEFFSGKTRIICATVAFGMGIDKPDVRYVIHYTLPRSPESYYQESGRAGRDGEYSECILLYSPDDAARVRSLVESDGTSGRDLRTAISRLRDMVAYCEETGCRRRFLLAYFGESSDDENCGSCDNCDHAPDMTDGTSQARLIISALQQVNGPADSGDLIALLRGSRSRKALAQGYPALAAFGTGKRFSREEYLCWINELVRQGFLARAGGLDPGLAVTGKGKLLIRGRLTVMFPAPGRS